jgi:hypothetical protein
MPKDSFGSFGFNPAPWTMSPSPGKGSGLNMAPGPALRSGPARRPGLNTAPGSEKEMPIGTKSIKVSDMSSGTKPGITPATASRDVPGVAEKSTAGSNMAGSVLDISPDSLFNSIILSEILGKPKCLQKTFRKRW